jgi:hypothetical protein
LSRVINTNGPGPRRNQAKRTIAEALRRLLAKPALDGEAKDLAATIVMALREVSQTVEESATAWDDRDYYLKADRFRREWMWAGQCERELTAIIREGRWDALPPALAKLLPHVADITITKFTRGADVWTGAYARLTSEAA